MTSPAATGRDQIEAGVSEFRAATHGRNHRIVPLWEIVGVMTPTLPSPTHGLATGR